MPLVQPIAHIDRSVSSPERPNVVNCTGTDLCTHRLELVKSVITCVPRPPYASRLCDVLAAGVYPATLVR